MHAKSGVSPKEFPILDHDGKIHAPAMEHRVLVLAESMQVQPRAIDKQCAARGDSYGAHPVAHPVYIDYAAILCNMRRTAVGSAAPSSTPHEVGWSARITCINTSSCKLYR